MNKFYIYPAVLGLFLTASCSKEQSAEERNAQIEREVQQRIAAERQSDEQQRLAQQQTELEAREKALAEKESAARGTTESAAQSPATTSRNNSTPSLTTRRDSTGPRSAPRSYSMFYDKLEPYGDWRESSDYGYVWQPREAQQTRAWRPYTDGRWVYTDAGWTWVSEEPHGWATYHYGRWTRLRGIGWVWVPGDEWAPAWVSWRTSSDYVGWAPLPPGASFDRRVGIQRWADNYYDIGPEQYAFVSVRELGAPRIGSAILPPERNVTIINQTTNVTNITYNNSVVVNQGPNYDELRTRSAQPIERYRLQQRTDTTVMDQRPVVRGEYIEMSAPSIPQTQTAERPRNLKGAIARAVVDYSGGASVDRSEVERARVKMKAEATPPPDAPAKSAVGATAANETSAVPVTQTPASRTTIAPSPTATASPKFGAAASPISAKSPTASPTPTATLSASASPSPAATVTPSATEPPGAAVVPSQSPSATASPSARFPQERKALRNAAKPGRYPPPLSPGSGDNVRTAPRATPMALSPSPVSTPALEETATESNPASKDKTPNGRPNPTVPEASPMSTSAVEVERSARPLAAPRITPPSAIITPPPQQGAAESTPLGKRAIPTRPSSAETQADAPVTAAPAASASPSASEAPPLSDGSDRKEHKPRKRLQEAGEPEPDATASPSPSAP